MRMVIPSALLILATVFLVGGCAAKSPPPSGFLDDYSSLTESADGAMRYISPHLAQYSSFILDPVVIQVQSEDKPLQPERAAEVAAYFNETLANELASRGYTLSDQPGVGVARVRIAVTSVAPSTGTGRGAMEGEVADSVTGEQLAAVVQAGKGNQFQLDKFSSLDDVKGTIDKWCENAGKRIDELRGKNPVSK